MKPNYITKGHPAKQNCEAAPCLNCADCKVVNFEEKRTELKANTSQLYAKEAEHYFFYYALNMKQGS
jgi:hypothetical protein